jgi:hypothetical protein
MGFRPKNLRVIAPLCPRQGPAMGRISPPANPDLPLSLSPSLLPTCATTWLLSAPPPTLVSFTWAPHLWSAQAAAAWDHSTLTVVGTAYQSSCCPAAKAASSLPPLPPLSLLILLLFLFFVLPAQQRWARSLERKSLLGPDAITPGSLQRKGLPAAHKVSWAACLYIQRRRVDKGPIAHQSQQFPHVCTNHGSVHYTNKGLCLHQSQVFCWAKVLPLWPGWKRKRRV